MGKVDYVVQTAGAVDQPLRNITQQSRNREDVLLATGSRYSPSAPLKEITRFLGQPGKFAFVGKPCDVVGLRNYAQVDSRVSERIPFMLSFMCAGTPSLCGTLALLQKLEVSPEDVTSIRYRGMGWPGLMSVTTQDGRCLRMAYDEAWGKLSRYLQFRCKICPDGVGEFADLTCADAWHLENGSPSFTERDGESLVISRTIEGEQLILDALAVGVIAAGALESDRLSYMQPYQAARKQAIFPRLLAMRMVGLPTPLYRNFRLGEAALRGGPKSAVTSFTGTLARLVLGTSFDVPELPLRRRFHRQSSPERSLARLCKQ
jgi:coenzyme F420 hydrogenase subunit beta